VNVTWPHSPIYFVRVHAEDTACAGGEAELFAPAVIVDGQVQACDWTGPSPRVRHRREVVLCRDTGAMMITELFSGTGRHEIEVYFAQARASLSNRGAERLLEVARIAPWARAGFDLERAVEIGSSMVVVPFANQGLVLELLPTLRYLLRASLPCVLNLAVVPYAKDAHGD
jgi:hypothetical protein